MRSEDVNEPDSCLGVISLPVSARLIAIIQLSYSLVSLIMIFTTNELSPLTDINSLTTLEALKYSQQIFIYATGFVAACLLGIGSLMSVEFLKNAIKSKNITYYFRNPRRPDYLIVWLLLTSLQPLLFLTVLVCEAMRLDITALAFTMASHGLQFILGLYFIHLMLALHRQLSCRLAYERLDTGASVKSYSAI